MMKFIEWVANTQVRFILKNYNNTNLRVKQNVKMALDTFLQAAQNTPDGVHDPNYLEAILSLEDILPALKQDPTYKKSAEELEMVLMADKQQLGI